ncbi:MAG: hypothetical protein HY744_19305 [Deltaproteobacteria bacterium]|nr:hypothetical protein [Deltaproteobacteria bacterium]
MGIGEPVIVPMRRATGDTWRGSVQTARGELRRLAYSIERGLWFRREDDG